jgi:hypothetical protein
MNFTLNKSYNGADDYIKTSGGREIVKVGYPFVFYDGDADYVAPIKVEKDNFTIYVRAQVTAEIENPVELIKSYIKTNPDSKVLLYDYDKQLLIYDLTQNKAILPALWSRFLPKSHQTGAKPPLCDLIGISRDGLAIKFYGSGVPGRAAMLAWLANGMMMPSTITDEGIIFVSNLILRAYGYETLTSAAFVPTAYPEVVIEPKRDKKPYPLSSLGALTGMRRKWEDLIEASIDTRYGAEYGVVGLILPKPAEDETEPADRDGEDGITQDDYDNCMIDITELIAGGIDEKYVYTGVSFSKEQLPNVKSAFIKDKRLYVVTDFPEAVSREELGETIGINPDFIIIMSQKDKALEKEIEHDISCEM